MTFEDVGKGFFFALGVFIFFGMVMPIIVMVSDKFINTVALESDPASIEYIIRFRDSMLQAFQYLPLLMFIAIVLYVILLAVRRRRYEEVYTVTR